jgi:thiamine pyrophosphate-dependent enzyme
MSENGWHRVDPADVPAVGRVRSAVVAGRSVALSRCGDRLGALENRSGRPRGLLRRRGDPSGAGARGRRVRPAARAARAAEALRRAEERGELTYVGIRHEGAAAFAASAYGKLTGRPAACLAIAGPGSTNLLTGLYDAKLDGAPVVAISGQVPSNVLGRGAFQDLDLSAVFGDVAVSSTSVHGGSDHGELAALAVKHAVDHRGVAHLVLPDEVQTMPSDAAAVVPDGRRADRRARPAESAVGTAATLVRDARRPVIIAGHGARGAEDELRALAERLAAPVLTTFKAKGLVPDTHPLARHRRSITVNRCSVSVDGSMPGSMGRAICGLASYTATVSMPRRSSIRIVGWPWVCLIVLSTNAVAIRCASAVRDPTTCQRAHHSATKSRVSGMPAGPHGRSTRATRRRGGSPMALTAD